MDDLTTGMIVPSPAGHGREYADRIPMHRDDLEAQRAWVTAKRIHEQVLHARSPEPAGSRRTRMHVENRNECFGDWTCRPASSL